MERWCVKTCCGAHSQYCRATRAVSAPLQGRPISPVSNHITMPRNLDASPGVMVSIIRWCSINLIALRTVLALTPKVALPEAFMPAQS